MFSSAHFIHNGDKQDHHNGKHIAFLGDQEGANDPPPAIFPDSMWKWTECSNFPTAIDQVQTCYKNLNNRNTLHSVLPLNNESRQVPRAPICPLGLMTWMLQRRRSAWELFLEVERIQITWVATNRSKLEPLKTFAVAATCHGAARGVSQRAIFLDSSEQQSKRFRAAMEVRLNETLENRQVLVER